ncbi:hypothetical protein RJ55_06844 [Drechmeria coniospora]|nr:hypothetical protein RJ55_06844 [Drechmeria coniospora]
MEPQGKLRAEKKNRLMEFNETQIIKANLDSPSGPKLRRRDMSEPTMTLHTRAATSDIYDIFNAPIKTDTPEDESADDNDYDTDGDYTTEVESTGTPQHVDANVGTGKNAADQEAREAQTSGPDETEIIEPVEQSDHFAEYSSPLQAETDAETLTPRARTTFVPVPPEDYDPPTRPFRDPVETANNRLPFMTPITERTECSLDMSSEYHRHLKTPCKVDAGSPAMSETLDLGPLFSTLREIADEETPVSNRPVSLNAGNVAATSSTKSKALFPKQPIIKDRLCNPVDETVRKDILEKMQPSLASYPGFYDHGEGRFDRGHEIRRFAKAVSKANNKGAVDRAPLPPASISICFPETGSEYHVKRELGAGAFAPVYLVEKSPSVSGDGLQDDVLPLGKGSTTIHHNELRALKMESPPTAWEFHIMRTAHARLGPQHRASDSLSYAFEMHLYRDEAFLFLPYHPHGTLLDIVNYFRSEPSGVMDEQLAMFFAIELIRTVESLHSNGIMHGDLKADNCLLRLDSMAAGQPLATHWKADGSGGWSSRGLTLIDFGRSIDMEAFLPEVEFIADWKTSAQDCAEMREGRPWTWQIDYHGLAGIVHCLLFGKYIETTRCDQLGLVKSGRRYKIREGLKRYWQTDLWADCFDVLLNPASFVEAEENTKMPVQTSMKRIRERMESWLETNSERGTGLRSLMGKLEAYAKSRK